MDSFNIAVFASGNGSNLQSLLETKKLNNQDSIDVSVVFSNKLDAYALKRAEKNNIPFFSVNPASFENREKFDAAVLDKLKTFNFDLIVLAGYMRILSKEFLREFEGKIINLHPSLLPKYPGLNTHKNVVDNKESHHGATVHFVDEGLDTGQIIGFSKFKVKEYEIHHLEAKVHEIEHKLLPLICSLIKNKRLKFKNNVLEIDNIEYPDGKEFNF